MRDHHWQLATAQRRSGWAVCFIRLLVTLVFLAGCGRVGRAAPPTRDDRYAVTLATEPAQPALGRSVVVVTLKDTAGKPIDGAQLSVEGNMSHAGMVPVTGHTQNSLDGVYRVPLEFTMAGDWYLDIVFTLSDGQTVVRRLPMIVR
jgi:hypothetical protein